MGVLDSSDSPHSRRCSGGKRSQQSSGRWRWGWGGTCAGLQHSNMETLFEPVSLAGAAQDATLVCSVLTAGDLACLPWLGLTILLPCDSVIAAHEQHQLTTRLCSHHGVRPVAFWIQANLQEKHLEFDVIEHALTPCERQGCNGLAGMLPHVHVLHDADESA